VGIDTMHLAITLIEHQLHDAYGDQGVYQVVGEPEALPDAMALAAEEPYQFQWWALGHMRW
jgi:site-specific DNA-methyltransferase (adenine-specific)